jgi:phosphopantetheinyl transferase (holo-ACP synthase)
LIFHGKVLELLKDSGATSVHLSLSHTTEHAIAEVVLEKTTEHSR